MDAHLAHNVTPVNNASPDVTWVDDLSHDDLLATLAAHGTELDGDPGHAELEEYEGPNYELIPLGDAWFRLEPSEDGHLWGHFVPDARSPYESDGRPPVRFDESADDLTGWMTSRADIDASGRRWVSVLRRPEREAYVALLYDAAAEGPQRQLVIAGVYPDVALVDGGRMLAFVEADRELRGAQRAIIAYADERYEASRHIVAYAETGGLAVRACSVRRFFKLSRGIRSQRVWDLVDARQPQPRPISVPGVPREPDLFDVALMDGQTILVQAVNQDQHWTLRASLLIDGEILSSWTCASGRGHARDIYAGEGYAVVRVGADAEETLHRVPLEGFSTRAGMLRAASGLLDLGINQVTPSIGFGATELSGGVPPYSWYWDAAGGSLNDPAEVASRAARAARGRREKVLSDDQFEFDLDLRWAASAGETFTGPVVLMLYGAYGLDIDLDTDPDLAQWLNRGFAVATPHVRGGGPEARHLAGTRAKRDRSLADAAAAVRHLRDGVGAVHATAIVTLGASAGGFLSATTLNTCPDLVDVCVIVNGYVDPLTSLLRQDTQTTASDQDEWGDPSNPNDLETLRAVSPVDNLTTSLGAEALVIVSGRDVRVNPRQGLKWFLRYTALGGPGELWFDPMGAHDCWGAGMPRTALVDWVTAALDRRREAVAA
ncbi:prolyl oligopeptidase family serine peptidase [Nigerium massiliense]|uniref:prolyl oligopeptidase family serine peptidase n=1 Tax=Nigerium massiliense TaxID=1522317 RepID=UPI0005905E32|nr:prolyl oligopeptidase family serine peptidase [Nigerium massiliense]